MHIIVQSTSVLLCLLVIAGDRSFVDSAPVGESQEQEHVLETKESDDVRQLESLKHSLGKTLAMMKSQSAVYTDINGQREAHADSRTEVDADGKLMARVSQHLDSNGPDGGSAGDSTPSSRVRTDIDIPSRGIHKSIVQENVPGGGIGARMLPNGPQTQQSASEITDNGNRRGDIMMPDVTRDINNNLEKYTAYTSGVQYSPLDMAEYVFWTGDEKGVTLAIEEFLQDGLMTREEAIAFLQEIKFNLDYLQAHYSQQGLRSVDMQKEEQIAKERANRIQQNGVRFPSAGLRFRDPRTEFGQQKTFDISDLRKGMEKKSGLEQLKQNQRKEESSISDEEYEGLLERLRVADFLYTEYSLEEVIYQLAKVMFSQSLTRGSAEAQDALQKFTTFLESETEQGHISRSLEKKVLDVLIAALTDTLTEHPELVPAAREGLGGGTAPRLPPENHLLQQILDLTPEEKEAAQASLYAAFKGHNGHQIRQDNSHTGRDKSLPLSAPKYKTA